MSSSPVTVLAAAGEQTGSKGVARERAPSGDRPRWISRSERSAVLSGRHRSRHETASTRRARKVLARRAPRRPRPARVACNSAWWSADDARWIWRSLVACNASSPPNAGRFSPASRSAGRGRRTRTSTRARRHLQLCLLLQVPAHVWVSEHVRDVEQAVRVDGEIISDEAVGLVGLVSKCACDVGQTSKALVGICEQVGMNEVGRNVWRRVVRV